MELKCNSYYRSLWVLQTAQDWFNSQKCTDITVSCDGIEFQCHKLILSGFLGSYINESLLEETDYIILADVADEQFQDIINILYKFSREEETPKEVNHNLKQEVLSDHEQELEYEMEMDNINGDGDHMHINIQEPKVEIQEEPEFEETPLINVGRMPFKKKEEKVGLYNCPLCNGSYNKPKRYELHFKKQHPNEEYREPILTDSWFCLKCEISFATKEERSLHYKTHRNQDRAELVPCELCGEDIKKRYLTQHMRQKHATFQCSCGAEFNELSLFYDHKNENKLEEHNLMTQIPGKKPQTEQANSEIKSETGLSGGISCFFCDMTFSNVQDLKQHLIDSHWDILKAKDMIWYSSSGFMDVKLIPCTEGCDLFFNHVYRLKQHIAAKHSNDTEPVVCYECGKSFKNNASLGAHIKNIHHKQKRKCQYCDYETIHQNQLKEHERSHTGEKPEICNFCGQGFGSKGTLVAHMRIHTGEKPFKCRFCDARFAQRNSANVHANSHHKDLINGSKMKLYEFIKS